MTSDAKLVPNNDSLSGMSVGQIIAEKYQIEGYLGQGGMGTVFRAKHLHLNCEVALKVMHQHFADNDEVVARMIEEARAVAQLRSHHVARVLDAGQAADNTPYIVMEYLEGEDLGALVLREGALDPMRAVGLVLQACEAVAEAHARGIIHRDLKPENLFLTRRADAVPMIKVLDFGIAMRTGTLSPRTTRLTNPATAMGSPHYMSPEQMRASSEVDARSDIWSIGAILFELIVGRPPFDGESLPTVCALVLSGETPSLREAKPGLPEELEAVISCCLRKDRNDRYSHVAELAWDLSRFGDAEARDSATRVARVLHLTNPNAGFLAKSYLTGAGQNVPAEHQVTPSGRSMSSLGAVVMPVTRRPSWGSRASALGLGVVLTAAAFLLPAWFNGAQQADTGPTPGTQQAAATPRFKNYSVESLPLEPPPTVTPTSDLDAGEDSEARAESEGTQKAANLRTRRRVAPQYTAPVKTATPPHTDVKVNPFDRENFGNRF